MVVLTPVDGDRIALNEHRAVKPGTASSIDHLAVYDLDINQKKIPSSAVSRWDAALLRTIGHRGSHLELIARHTLWRPAGSTCGPDLGINTYWIVRPKTPSYYEQGSQGFPVARMCVHADAMTGVRHEYE
jgi:hypothetical protein